MSKCLLSAHNKLAGCWRNRCRHTHPTRSHSHLPTLSSGLLRPLATVHVTFSTPIWYTEYLFGTFLAHYDDFWSFSVRLGYMLHLVHRWRLVQTTVTLVTLFLHARHNPWWVLVLLVHFGACDVWYTSWYTTPISTPSGFLVHFWHTRMIFGHFQYIWGRCYVWYTSDVWYSNTSNIVFTH